MASKLKDTGATSPRPPQKSLDWRFVRAVQGSSGNFQAMSGERPETCRFVHLPLYADYPLRDSEAELRACS